MEARQGGATLDRLSGGRLIVGVGLGGRGDLEPVGEAVDEAERAALVDEGLEVLVALWSGEPQVHRGAAFRLAGAKMLPRPLQRPRIPIWVAGFWPNKRPFRRAARWDGAVPLRRGLLLEGLSPAELRDCRAYIRTQRADDDRFDLLAFGTSRERSLELAECEAAGATWWLEAVNPLEEPVAEFRARMTLGPPRSPTAAGPGLSSLGWSNSAPASGRGLLPTRAGRRRRAGPTGGMRSCARWSRARPTSSKTLMTSCAGPSRASLRAR